MEYCRFIKNFFFIGSFYHLWYLHATVIGAILTCICLHKGCKLRSIMAITAVFYGIGLLGESYYGLISPFKGNFPILCRLCAVWEDLFYRTRNGFFEGFPLIAVGVMVAWRNPHVSPKKCIAGFCISFLLTVAEYYTVKHYGLVRYDALLIFMVPTAFFLFSFARNLQLADSAVYRTLRHLSALIYFIHVGVNEVLELFCATILRYYLAPGIAKFTIVLSITFLLSLAIIRLSRCRGFHWLRALYA